MTAPIRHPSILVVESRPDDLRDTATILRSAGYSVAEASEFHEASRLIESAPPDLLVTGVKLGAYNGLHLVVRTHAKYPAMASILTNDDADPVLEAEAGRQHATYLTRPWRQQDFLNAVTRCLEQSVPPPASAGAA